ncbi:hypothetical protein IW261DRAFT_1428193 [Armillaria novae-zelandiae]|uniref:Uncharacterized protein n=1 Tax=Armillaria novae-zelandiae TaxID=153914 RepID=A0AA39NAS7_9AGAR|nr:hypothetical protein IW261DRAFT_1428193 [Armillaria novae-zelandiae]
MALAAAGIMVMCHGSTPEWKGRSLKLKICHRSGRYQLYYIHVGLQTRDAFFGNMKQIHPRSPNLVDKFPAKVLLEAERRYAKDLARESVDKLSILSGWMAVTLEMEAANQGMVYTYHASDWNYWMARLGGLRPKHFFQSGDHVEMPVEDTALGNIVGTGKSEDIYAVGVTRVPQFFTVFQTNVESTHEISALKRFL